MEVNLITVTAFGLLVGTGVVVVAVPLLTVGKAVETSGAYFSKLKYTQKYVISSACPSYGGQSDYCGCIWLTCLLWCCCCSALAYCRQSC